MSNQNNHRQRRGYQRRDSAKEILEMFPTVAWSTEVKILTVVAYKLGSNGKPLFDVNDLIGNGRWDKIKDAVRRGINRRGPGLTRHAVWFAKEQVT